MSKPLSFELLNMKKKKKDRHPCIQSMINNLVKEAHSTSSSHPVIRTNELRISIFECQNAENSSYAPNIKRKEGRFVIVF